MGYIVHLSRVKAAASCSLAGGPRSLLSLSQLVLLLDGARAGGSRAVPPRPRGV